MDNRNDVTEDQQSTPQHLAFNAQTGDALPGEQDASRAASSGLSSGPHNDPPPGPGIEDTYQAPTAAKVHFQRWSSRYWGLSLVGVTLAVVAIRALRSR